MSNITLNGASLEFARSLEVDTIPEKLRCATCDKLAIHAVRLPCCDSTICGDCKDTLTATECPICSHSPFSAENCTPAKALQTTVKVFIKNEAKKRSIDITGDTPKPIAAAPVHTPETLPAAAVATATSGELEPTTATGGEVESVVVPDADEVPSANGEAPPELQIESQSESVPLNTEVEQTEAEAGDAEQDDDDDDDDDDVVITTERPENEDQQFQGQESGQYNGQTNGPGESAGQNMQMDQQSFNNFNPGMGNFGNMNMNGFNPMMAMPNFGMGMNNMMGMPGMGMDPSMMFGGNFGGMDMSAMMGMGMSNMGGDMSGMGNFGGMGGPGFFPNQGNYMQSQNYGNAHRQNFYHDRGYGRGYGRGFGRGPRGNQFGRGRGGWNNHQQYGQNYQQFAQGQSVGPQQSGANSADVAPQRRASPSYGPNGRQKSNDAETNGNQEAAASTNQTGDDTNTAGDGKDEVMQNGDQENGTEHDPTKAHDDQTGGSGVDVDGTVQHADESMMDVSGMQSEAYAGFDTSMHNQEQYGHDSDNFNNFGGRGGFRGRGGYQARGTDVTELTPTPAPPVNAPTGPKAMREGRLNAGWAGRWNAPQVPTPMSAPQRSASQARSVELPGEDASKQDTHDYNGPDRGRSASRSRSQRRSSKDRARPADGYYDSDEYSRRKDRERRKRREREERNEHDDRGDRYADDRKYRSRSQSRTDDSSRRRHRHKNEEHRSSRSHRDRSKDRHRSRRHRSKSPAKDYTDEEYSRRKSKGDREREADHDDHRESRRSRKSSKRDDDYQHDGDRKDRTHRSSKHDRPSRDSHRDRDRDREAPRKIIEPPSDELGFKIKGSKSARAEKDRESKMAPPDPPASASADPYAEERARAQQGREAREAQRRLSTQSSSLGKRGREEEDALDTPRGPKGDRTRVTKKGRKERRMNVKYEDEIEDENQRWR